MDYSLALLIATAVGSGASLIGSLFILYAYRNQFDNNIKDIIKLRDEVIKISLVAQLSATQRAELLPAIEQAFGRADDEFAATIGLALGPERAKTISRSARISG